MSSVHELFCCTEELIIIKFNISEACSDARAQNVTILAAYKYRVNIIIVIAIISIIIIFST